jgi:hypothetical protein
VLVMGCQRADPAGPAASPAPAPAPAGAATRRISFSGHEWVVKSASEEAVGPGPNYFADGADAVWIDANGRLHLRLRFKHGRWWAAEVVSAVSFGHGRYEFRLDHGVDDLDPNVVVGFFTWSDDPEFAHREIDVELGRWGQERNDLGQCVVQPYDLPGNLVRFPLPRGVRWPVFSFIWRPDGVVCEVRGTPPGQRGKPDSLLYRHAFANVVPARGDEHARINLWLLGGQAPRHGRDVEIVVTRFDFRALSPRRSR